MNLPECSLSRSLSFSLVLSCSLLFFLVFSCFSFVFSCALVSLVLLFSATVFLTCLFQHLLRLVVHSLSFRRSVFGPTTAVLLDNIARN